MSSPAAIRVLVPCGNGSEDIELTCIVDTLRRAKFDVRVASVEAERTIKLARGCVLVADSLIGDETGAPFDAIALPGGMPGAERLRDCPQLIELLKAQKAAGRWYAAICASPAVALTPHGLLDAVACATCYPTFAARLPAAVKVPPHARVVVDAQAKCITSRGPGTAIEFALQLISCLAGRDAAVEVGTPMLLEDASLAGIQ